MDGITYKAEELANLTLSRSLDGKGFYGVSTSQLSCDIYTGHALSEGAEITLNGFFLPTFIIAEQSFENNVAHVVAYDRCKNLDVPFNYSGYEQFDSDGKAKWYPTSQIVAALANQCGFASGSYTGNMEELCYLDFAEKSCRQIITELSKVDVGYYACSADNRLIFRSFSPGTGGLEIDDADRAAITLKGSKTISGIYAEDEIYGGEYHTGAPWQNTEKLSGRYLTDNIVQRMAGKILSNGGSYVYHGWECRSALLRDTLLDIGDCISYDGKSLPVLNAVYSFTDMGIIASLSAPAPDNSFSQYEDIYKREISKRLVLDKTYNDFFLGVNGLGVRINESDSGTARAAGSDTDEYRFEASKGGLVRYDGAMLTDIQPSGTLTDTDNGAEFSGKYESGQAFIWGYTEDDSGNIKFYRKEVKNDG